MNSEANKRCEQILLEYTRFKTLEEIPTTGWSLSEAHELMVEAFLAGRASVNWDDVIDKLTRVNYGLGNIAVYETDDNNRIVCELYKMVSEVIQALKTTKPSIGPAMSAISEQGWSVNIHRCGASDRDYAKEI